jgi:hypothetical protein
VKPGSEAFQHRIANATPSELDKGYLKMSLNVEKPIGYGYANPAEKYTKLTTGQVLNGELSKVENMQWVKVNFKFNDSTNNWVIDTMFPSKGG